MAATSDVHELWIGTPNEMARIMRGTLADIKTRAKRELGERRKMAEKYDNASLVHITEAGEGITGLTPLSFKNGPRTWTFPYIGINYRIEVK